MPRQAGCCCNEKKCCLHPGWYVNNGYYYADSPPPNANPAKALDRAFWSMDEVIIDGVHDLTFVLSSEVRWTCVDGVLKRKDGLNGFFASAAHSFKVVGDPLEAGINVAITNLLALSSSSYVDIHIAGCTPGANSFHQVYSVPDYLDDVLTAGQYEILQPCDTIDDLEFETTELVFNPGVYTAFIGAYFGANYGFNKDAVVDVNFIGFDADNLCSRET